MKNILLTISYDGTDFCGWQRQDLGNQKNCQRTVQGQVELALEKMLKNEITLYGSGRTDSGVHAIGQAANFYSPFDSIPQENYVRALNAILPNDIRIISAKEVCNDFNARKNATSRIYRYFINPGYNLDAIQNRFSWNVHYNANFQNLNKMASILKGETDCASFAASGDESVSTCRYIDGARFFETKSFLQNENLIVFEIEANAFLWKMVRTITGTLIWLDKTGKSVQDFKKIIELKDRKFAGITAPANGLFLYKINFDGIRKHI